MKNKIKIIIIVVLLFTLSIIGLKLFINKHNYFSLLNTEMTDSKFLFRKDSLIYLKNNLIPGLKPRNQDSLQMYYSTIFYYNFHANYPKIHGLRLQIKYLGGFVLRINNKIAFISPNNVIDKNGKLIYLVEQHTDSTYGYFYYTDCSILSSQNTIELNVLSQTPVSDNYQPQFNLEGYFKGYFFKIPQVNLFKKDIKPLASDLPVLKKSIL